MKAHLWRQACLLLYIDAWIDAFNQTDGRSNRERMLAGDQYIADDPDLVRESHQAANLIAAFNTTDGDDQSGRDRILRELFGSIGESTA